MSFVVFAAALSFGLQGQPKPDRSGEPALRKILAWAKSLDAVHVVIARKSRESAGTPMYLDSRLDVWLSGTKFRVETSDGWGDASVLASDGVSVLNDSESEWEPARLSEAKGGILGSFEALKLAPDDYSPFLNYLGGPEALDKLVEKTASIRSEPEQQGEQILSYEAKKLGAVRLYFHEDKGAFALDRIDYDNKPVLDELYKANADWLDPPEPGGLTRHEIIVLPERPAGSLFSVKAPKGRQVQDMRAKKPAGGSASGLPDLD